MENESKDVSPEDDHTLQLLAVTDTTTNGDLIVMAIKPELSKKKIIPVTILIDLGRTPDEEKEKNYSLHPSRHSPDEVSRSQFRPFQQRTSFGDRLSFVRKSDRERREDGDDFLYPQRLYRQRAVFETEQPFFQQKDPGAEDKNYIYFLNQLLDNLAMFVQTCQQSGCVFKLTVRLVRQLEDNEVLSLISEVNNSKENLRKVFSSLLSSIYNEREFSKKKGWEKHDVKGTEDVITEFASNEKGEYYVISRDKPTDEHLIPLWYRYHTDSLLPASILSENLRKLLPVIAKQTSMIVKVRSPSIFRIACSDQYKVTDQSRVVGLNDNSQTFVVNKKDFRLSDTIYLYLRDYENRCRNSRCRFTDENFLITLNMIKGGKNVFTDTVRLKEIKIDRWFTGMVEYLMKNIRLTRDLQRGFSRRLAGEASKLNLLIAGMDLSFPPDHKSLGVEYHIIWRILQMKSTAMFILSHMANRLSN